MRNYDINKYGLLTAYSGNAAHPVIPKEVTAIGQGAFNHCKTLISIKIPSGVECICSDAFYGCTNLKKINIHSSVIFISDNAFNDCENLTSIEIPNSVKRIGNDAFRHCKNLLSVVIPNNVGRIECCTFYDCTSLRSINIPSSVKQIDSDAFNGCTSLNSINIPNSVTHISSCAFNDIHNIKPQYNTNGTLRAFKAFNKDWTCRNGFQYEVGKSYHQDGDIECCWNGFHACTNPLYVFNYYWGNLSELHFAEVELSGAMDWENDKVAASDIKIVRELSASELAEIYSNMEKC